MHFTSRMWYDGNQMLSTLDLISINEKLVLYKLLKKLFFPKGELWLKIPPLFLSLMYKLKVSIFPFLPIVFNVVLRPIGCQVSTFCRSYSMWESVQCSGGRKSTVYCTHHVVASNFLGTLCLFASWWLTHFLPTFLCQSRMKYKSCQLQFDSNNYM